jgi:Kef-type K+ transport system membrane component KefB
MKTLLTVLFFTDTLVLIVLSFLLLKWLDNGISGSALTLLLIAIGSCIFLLGFLLVRYINLPIDKKYMAHLKEDAGNDIQ